MFNDNNPQLDKQKKLGQNWKTLKRQYNYLKTPKQTILKKYKYNTFSYSHKNSEIVYNAES